jgi:hypothetical protein
LQLENFSPANKILEERLKALKAAINVEAADGIPLRSI